MNKTPSVIAIAFIIIGVLFIGLNFFYSSSFQIDRQLTNNNNNNNNLFSSYPTIAYIGFAKEQQPFWTELGELSEEAALTRKIVYLDLTPKIPSSEEQVNSINQAINQNVDGIILGANLPSSLTQVLARAYEKNIPIVAVDTDLDSPAVVSVISTDNLESAKLAGEFIVNATGGKGTLLIICGEKTHPNSIAREKGVREKAELAGMDVITHYADWQIEKAYSFAFEELSKPNNITVIFACWDPGIISVEQVVESKGLGGKIILVGFDGLQETYREIKNGKISATIAQPIKQMAREGVETIVDYLNNKTVQRVKSIAGILVSNSAAGNVGYFLD